MLVQEKHVYHGIALTQVVEHDSFKAINCGSPKFGHYLINNDRHIFVKYSTAQGPTWQFTFRPEEINALKEALKKSELIYICLVCGKKTVCALNLDEIKQLISPDATEQQSIFVDVPPRSSCRVRNSRQALKRTIPHNSFPEKIFE